MIDDPLHRAMIEDGIIEPLPRMDISSALVSLDRAAATLRETADRFNLGDARSKWVPSRPASASRPPIKKPLRDRLRDMVERVDFPDDIETEDEVRAWREGLLDLILHEVDAT